MKSYKKHFGNHLQLGSTDPYASTNRLLALGIIRIPQSEEINVPQATIDEWYKMWREQYLKAELLLSQELLDKVNTLSDEVRHNMIVNTYILLIPAEDDFFASGTWDWVLAKRIDAYREKQKSTIVDTASLQSETLIMAAKRETAKLGREALEKIFLEKGQYLSLDEKDILSKFFLRDVTKPIDTFIAIEAPEILKRIYGNELLINKTPWNPNTGEPENTNVFTTTNWETEQQELQKDISIKESTYISPLETAFLKAGDEITNDIKTVSTTLTKDNKNLFLYLGLGFLLYKTLRR